MKLFAPEIIHAPYPTGPPITDIRTHPNRVLVPKASLGLYFEISLFALLSSHSCGHGQERRINESDECILKERKAKRSSSERRPHFVGPFLFVRSLAVAANSDVEVKLILALLVILLFCSLVAQLSKVAFFLYISPLRSFNFLFS